MREVHEEVRRLRTLLTVRHDETLLRASRHGLNLVLLGSGSFVALSIKGVATGLTKQLRQMKPGACVHISPKQMKEDKIIYKMCVVTRA
jgi:hypothetical protein